MVTAAMLIPRQIKSLMWGQYVKGVIGDTGFSSVLLIIMFFFFKWTSNGHFLIRKYIHVMPIAYSRLL